MKKKTAPDRIRFLVFQVSEHSHTQPSKTERTIPEKGPVLYGIVVRLHIKDIVSPTLKFMSLETHLPSSLRGDYSRDPVPSFLFLFF